MAGLRRIHGLRSHACDRLHNPTRQVTKTLRSEPQLGQCSRTCSKLYVITEHALACGKEMHSVVKRDCPAVIQFYALTAVLADCMFNRNGHTVTSLEEVSIETLSKTIMPQSKPLLTTCSRC